MVWYYCEFCNKNIQMKNDAVNICRECGHFLHNPIITSKERRRREQERNTYCDNCDLMVYGISIELARNSINEESIHKINLIKNPPKTIHYVKDGRYKSGYRTTKEGEQYETKMCCYCFLVLIFIGVAFITYGITLVGLIPIYYYYNKKQKEKQQQINKLVNETQITEQTFFTYQQQGFRFICRRCFSPVKLGMKIPSRISKSKKIEVKTFICEKCGYENNIESKFCINCGISLDFIKTVFKARSRHISRNVMLTVWDRDGGKCVKCGNTENIQFDHIIPWSKGGANTIENIQILCRKCNLAKSNKIE